jgi:DNA-binding NarL/FixJ family response regulator
VERVKVLLAGMPGMLIDIVRSIVATDADLTVVGEAADQVELIDMARRRLADVVVLGPGLAAGREVHYDLLQAHPPLKIVAIGSDGRNAVLHELRPVARPLGEISHATLIAALRTASRPFGEWETPC